MTAIVFLSASSSRAAGTAIPFALNDGAQPASVRFYAQTFGGTVFVTEQGSIRYSLPKADRSGGCAMDEQFMGSPGADVAAGVPSVAHLSMCLGKDRARWRTALPCFDSVSLGEVYEGIRVDLRAYGKNVEKLFTVAPGACAEQIAVNVDGGSLCLDENSGELVVETAAGEVRFTRPVAYQEQDGVRTPVDVAYRVDGNAYGFALGDYDASRPVIIDPLLASTFVGGGDNEQAGGLAVDSGGNVYVGGSTVSVDFPVTTGSYGPTNNINYNAFVSVLDPGLSNLLASIVFGGDQDDYSTDLTIANNGRLYVAGYTYSTNFPATGGAFSTTLNGNGRADAFVSEVDVALTNIITATYLGGDDYDYASCLAVDRNGSVYVAGRTESTNFPVGADDYQQQLATGGSGNFDGFLSRLDPDLTTLLDSTYYGGQGEEVVNCIAIGNDNHAYIGGITQSSDLPRTALGYDLFINSLSGDGFVAVFSTNLNSLISATFLGGDSIDSVNALIAGAGLVYAAGSTRSDNFPATPNAYDTTPNGQLDLSDMFVTKMDYLLHNVMASTLIGGIGNDSAMALSVTTNGQILVAGRTQSPDFPQVIDTSGGLVGQNDAVVARLTPNLASLTYATYLGGDADDIAFDIARGPSGDIYVSGTANEGSSVDYPTTAGAFDTSQNGNSDVFVSRLTLTPADRRVAYDFNNDDVADVTVYNEASANWYILQSGSNILWQQNWGFTNVLPVAADYDGDTIADIAVYWPEFGNWYVLQSSNGQLAQTQWGWSGGYPVPADYDGDGKADYAVYNPETATWYILQSSNGQTRQKQWGWSATIPVPGDYDGDGVCDLAVYDPGEDVWYILRSSDDTLQQKQWGYNATVPVPGDYDGDGKTDIAVFDPTSAVWFILQSSVDLLASEQFGWGGVKPVAADYDGDGRDDIAVYDQASGGWYVHQSSDDTLRVQYWGWFDAEPVTLQQQINSKVFSF